MNTTVSSPLVHILVLNWNGWDDTSSCLESIMESDYQNYLIVVIDNGSSDDSLQKLYDWSNCDSNIQTNSLRRAKRRNIQIFDYDDEVAVEGGVASIEEKLSKMTSTQKIVLIKNKQNYGFAKGNNVGISYSIKAGADLIWLLNNDTVIEKDALSKQVSFMQYNPDVSVATAQIRYFYRPEFIWNCGGRLKWYGGRKYNYANEHFGNIMNRTSIAVTFITGCSMFTRRDLWLKVGLLTERFFFGEEDIEFSLRLRKFKYKMACIYDSVVYHKVGQSIDTKNVTKLIGKVYIYYLNRFINMRNYMPYPLWFIWRYCVLVYVMPMIFVRYKIEFRFIYKLCKALLFNSMSKNKVDKFTFDNAINFNIF